jgi:hypothetical protein
MFQRIKEWSAIKSYVMKLSLELFSRFGKKHYYSVKVITQTVERAGLEMRFLPYAHALFSERKDFRRYYKGSKFRDRYETLRGEVSVRYFGGVIDFDAANIIEAVRSLDVEGDFHESGAGFVGAFVH